MDHNSSINGRPKIDTSLFFGYIMENSLNHCILLLDKEGVILDCNSGILKTLGYVKEELEGKNFSLFFTHEDRMKKKPEIELVEVLQKGKSQDNNYAVHKDGSLIWVWGESLLARDSKGNFYIVKSIVDINQQKLLEKFLIQSQEELRVKNNRLEKVNKDLETFVYTASHDLKAPISNIDALLDSLMEELSEESRSTPVVSEIASMLKRSISAFYSTIADLTTVGKNQSEKDGVDEISSFKELLEEVKLNLKEVSSEYNATITDDFLQSPVIRFSRKNLRSILFNLLSNALKYHSPERKPVINLSTSKVDDSFILLKVSDNGLGIKEEDKAKVFSMYKRLHDHVEGTGVGMAIVARIMDQNGGRIEIDSEYGKGTTFKVYFRL